MKTTPIASPHQVHAPGPSAQSAQAARERAIAKMAPPPQAKAVPIPVDANNIAVEDLSAIQAPDSGQDITNVEETETVETAPLAEESAKVEPPPVKEEQPASSQMAILARKERALRAKAQQQDQAFKAREDALKAREAAVSAKDQEYQSGYISKQRLKQQTIEALAEAGLSYDEITQKQIDAGSIHPQVTHLIDSMKAEIQELKQQNENNKKSQEEAQSVQYKQALSQIKTDVKELVKSDPVAFEAIAQTNSVQDVVDLIEQTFKEENRVMSVEEAAQEVEDYLSEQAYKLSELKKVQKRRQQVSTTKAPMQTQTPVTKQPQPMKTLTNATSSSRQLSARERALLAFKGELKS